MERLRAEVRAVQAEGCSIGLTWEVVQALCERAGAPGELLRLRALISAGGPVTSSYQECRTKRIVATWLFQLDATHQRNTVLRGAAGDVFRLGRADRHVASGLGVQSSDRTQGRARSGCALVDADDAVKLV